MFRPALLKSHLAAAAMTAAFVSDGVDAQTVIRTWSPPTLSSIDALPDLDGDVFRELLVGDRSGALQRGEVYALGSLTNQKLYSYVGAPGDDIGTPVGTLGDMNGDGFPEFAAGSFVYVGTWIFDGRDGSLLFYRQWDISSIADLGDINDDGFDDALLGSGFFSKTYPGEANVYLGGSFELAYTIAAPENVAYFGGSCTAMADIDGDGVKDFAVGAPGVPGYLSHVGVVCIYSGKSGCLLYRLNGELGGSYFGLGLASPGDLNGDGIGDLAIGAPGCCGVPAPGRLYFFDGPSGELITKVDPPTGLSIYNGFGNYVTAVGDVDGNGFGDVLVAINDILALDSRVWLIDGGTRETIYDLRHYALSPIGRGLDWDGDDFPDFVLYNKAVQLWSGAPVGVSVLGQPCPSGSHRPPRIGSTGIAEIGEEYPIHLSRVRPNVPAVLVTGSAPVAASAALRRARAPCPLLLTPTTVYPARTREVRPGEGVATVEIAIPNDPLLQGSTFYAQWLVLSESGDPRVAASTRMLEIQIQ